jgi:hypothetical protein
VHPGGTGWSALDRRLAEALGSRGWSPQELTQLHDQAAQARLSHRGSTLGAGLVRAGRATAAEVDAMLSALVSGSGSGRLPPATQPDAPTVVPRGSGRLPPTPAPTASGESAITSLPPQVAALLTGARYAPEAPVTAETERVDAVDRTVQRRVHLRLGPPGGDLATFAREARILAQLEHPSVPAVQDLGTLGGRPFWCHDRLEGEPLSGLSPDQVAARRPALLRALLDVGNALGHAHRRGLAHGALGPERVLLGSFGQVWVTGWERAVALPEAGPTIARAAANPPEPEATSALAPEVRRGSLPDRRSDVYGLGAALHHVLFGAPPGTRAGHAPADLVAVCDKALARRPRERYRQVDALLEDLRNHLDGRRVTAHRESLPQALRRLARRHPGPAAVAALGLVATIALASVALTLSVREIRDAQAREADAADALDLARASAAKAEASRDAARRATQQATRSLTARVEIDRALEGADPERAEAALNRLEANLSDLGPAAPAVRRHLLERRWRWRFRRQDASLEGAATDLGALAAEGSPSPVHLLARWLVLRRLPGSARRAEERAALDALLGTHPGSPEAILVGLEERVQQAERLSWLGRQDAATSHAEEVIRALTGEPVEALEPRGPGSTHLKAPSLRSGYLGPGEAYASQLLGRARLAAFGLMRRHIQREPGPLFTGEKRWARLAFTKAAFENLTLSAQADPSALLTAAVILRQRNNQSGRIAYWRTSQARSWRRLLSASRRFERPGPLLEAAALLQDSRLHAAAVPLLEQAVALAEAEALSPEEAARLGALRAHAALWRGAPVSPSWLDQPAIPPELAAYQRLLRGWAWIREGELEDGLAELLDGLGDPPPGFWPQRRREQVLLQAARALSSDPSLAQRAAQLLLRGEARADPKFGASLRAAVNLLLDRPTAQLDLRHLSEPEQFEQALLVQNALAQDNPAAPRPVLVALDLLAGTNTSTYATARQAQAARAFLVSTLQARGADQAAQALEAIADPVGEVAPAKVWVPVELRADLQGRDP